jgi:transcriptional regulator with XRE-family HTH domain
LLAFWSILLSRCDDGEVVKIGANLKRARERAFKSQRLLAQEAGLSYPTVARIEKDRVEPHLGTIKKLADALGVDPAELVKDERSRDAR